MTRGTHAARAPRRIAWILSAIALGAGLWLAIGCGSGDPIVARGGDWRLTRSELATEFDRLYGPESYARTDPARREKFLTTAVHKQLLLDEARRAIPQISARGERRVRVRAAEALLTFCRQTLWQAWQPDSARLQRAREHLAREAHVLVIVVGRAWVADSCAAALRVGLPFEEAWRRFGGRWPDTREMDPGWRDPLWFPPRLMRAVFLDELLPGSITAPVETRRGIWIAKVLAYRPFDPRTRPGYEARLEAMLQRMLYRDARVAARDSLTRALGYRLFPEASPAVAGAIQAYLDSISVARPPGTPSEQWSLRAPVWRLSAVDRDRPLATLEGETLTAAGFLRTLDEIDVRQWPHLGPASRQVRDVEERMVRRILAIDAHRRGIDADPEYLQAVQLLRDEVHLDEYHESVLLPQIAVTSGEVDSLLKADPDRWVVPERIEFSAVIYPEEEGDAAEEFLQSVHGADAQGWNEQATAAVAAAERARFLATSDMLDVGRVLEPPSWEPMLKLAEKLRVGEIAGPVRVPELDGIAIVRLISRMPVRSLPPAAARVMAEREARLRKVETRVGQILEAAQRREGVQTWPQRLAPRGEGVR